MSEVSEIERAESLLWDAVNRFYASGAGSKPEAATAAVRALAAYRAAVEVAAVAPYVQREARTAPLLRHGSRSTEVATA